MNTNLKPLFIFSMPRSGSTLLQRILAASGQVATASEPWLLLPLLYTLKSEGVLAEYWHSRVCDAIEDFCEGFPNGKRDYLDELRMLVMNLYRKRSTPESRYFLDKTPRYNLICNEIINLFPDGRFIFLWRNPLAVVSSLVNSWYAGKWKASIYSLDLYDGIIRLINAFEANRSKVHSIRFEQIIQESSKIEDLFKYLELEYDDRILTSFRDVRLEGRMGDKVGTKKYNALNSSPTSAWVGTYCNPFRRHWASRYLEWIGPENLNVMGYDYSDLRTELQSGKKFSFNRIFSDMAFSLFISIRKTVSPLSVHRHQHLRHLYI